MDIKNDQMNRFIQTFVQRLLRTGLFLSLILMFLGILIKVASGDLSAPGITLHDIFLGALSLGDRLTALGALTLALTPAFRVISLLVLWMLEKDWVFVGVAFGVLCVLMISMSLGGG